MTMGRLPKNRLSFGDLMRTATVGLRIRKLRAALSAVGITIGIASIVGILGLSESSKSELLSRLERLGTNLLTVQPNVGFGRGSGNLPDEAANMIARIGPVEATSMISFVDGVSVYRTEHVPSGQTGGITVQAVDSQLLKVLAGSVADGTWLDDAKGSLPNVVLGSVAAERLGIREVSGVLPVRLGEETFIVVGILEQFELAPDLDRAALIGHTAAQDFLGHENPPSRVLVRVDPAQIDEVTTVLASTANPQFPEEVEVDRPTEALEAQEAADDTLTTLFVGLGAIALLVGGVGIANVMVISVLERRGEIGLRRALGATRRHIAVQFLGEALVLAALGGIGGIVLGISATAIYAQVKDWSILIPPLAILGGFGAALIIGGVAGLYPAMRASRLSPTEALRTT